MARLRLYSIWHYMHLIYIICDYHISSPPMAADEEQLQLELLSISESSGLLYLFSCSSLVLYIAIEYKRCN